MRAAIAMVFLLTAAAASAHVGGVNGHSARAVVQASEDAWKRMDFDKTEALHSDDCTVTDSSPGTDGKLVTKTGKCREMFDTGRKSLSDLKAKGGEIHYDSTVNTVRVQGDKAVVSLHAIVTMIMNGKTMRIESDQDETVQLRGGKLLITTSVSKTTSEIVDGRRIY
jgi:hypothetical protein